MKRILLSTVAIVGLTSAASAADLYAAPVIEEPGVVYAAPTFNWTGFYVGVQGGYAWSNHDVDLDAFIPGDPLAVPPIPDTFLSDSIEVDADGGLLGVNVGADLQVGSWVFGVMADYNWAGIEGEFEEDNVFGTGQIAEGDIEQDSMWNALLRAGYLINPQTLVYVLGGYSETDVELTMFDGTDMERRSDNLQGWTVGVGAEWMVTQNVSVKGEYRYTKYDDFEFGFTGPDVDASSELDQHSVFVGLNYRFGMGGL